MNLTHEPGDAPRSPARLESSRAAARAPQRGTSVAATIYRHLRDEIVSMHQKPGDPIVEKQLGALFGVSRTPIREALLRLADDGLVEIFPQSGTFIARIPIAALHEAHVIRRALEEATVGYAARCATPIQIARLRKIVEQQRSNEATPDHDRFHHGDEAFHAQIAETAGYPRFWTLTQQVKIQVDRCRRLTLPVPGRIDEVIGEHATIVDAIAAHAPERAVRAMTGHLDRLRLGISELRAAYPDYFIAAPDAAAAGTLRRHLSI
ncbi:MAG: GntR family transcriptional regulator [Azospirillaceae bacterium]|nr:GntR family transcriptional regulator [Azospirillaceae bacterium]